MTHVFNANIDKETNFEEICPWCDEPVEIVIDPVDTSTYQVTCPKCGKKMMLCTLCHWDQTDAGIKDPKCRWCKMPDGSEKCFRMLYAERKPHLYVREWKDAYEIADIEDGKLEYMLKNPYWWDKVADGMRKFGWEGSDGDPDSRSEKLAEFLKNASNDLWI